MFPSLADLSGGIPFVEMLMRTVLIMVTVIAIIRINGLRSISDMSAFDAAVTIAIGTVMGSGVTASGSSVWIPMGAIVALFLFQAVVARIRTRVRPFERAIDNAPRLLVEDGTILDHNLSRANVTRADLKAKLREAGVYDLGRVRAVVMESTGTVTVVHGNEGISPDMLEGVRR